MGIDVVTETMILNKRRFNVECLRLAILLMIDTEVAVGWQKR